MSRVRRTSKRFLPSSVAPGASCAAGSSSSSLANAYLLSTAVVIESSYVDILDIELLEGEDYPQIVRCQDIRRGAADPLPPRSLRHMGMFFHGATEAPERPADPAK